MCKAMEDMIREEKIEIALSLLADGELSIEKIAKHTKLSVEEVKELAEKQMV